MPLEDVKWLFEGELWVRCVQDAPGGRWVLGKRRAVGIEELKQRTSGDVVADECDVSDEENVAEKLSAVGPADGPLVI